MCYNLKGNSGAKGLNSITETIKVKEGRMLPASRMLVIPEHGIDGRIILSWILKWCALYFFLAHSSDWLKAVLNMVMGRKFTCRRRVYLLPEDVLPS